MKILKVKCLAPTRLDNYLTQQFPALTPGRLNKALRENKIKLNGKKQPLSTRVMAGDEIKLFILDEVLDADRRVEGPAWKNARGPAQVVYTAEPHPALPEPAGRVQGERPVHPGAVPPAGHRHQRPCHRCQDPGGRRAVPCSHQEPRSEKDLPLRHLRPSDPAGCHLGRLPAEGR